MNGDRRKFNGSNSFRDNHEHAQFVAGDATWVNEFEPIEYEHTQFFDRLLFEFFKYNVCCAIVGTFSAFRAGVFSSFNTVILAIADTKTLFWTKFYREMGGRITLFGSGRSTSYDRQLELHLSNIS